MEQTARTNGTRKNRRGKKRSSSGTKPKENNSMEPVAVETDTHSGSSVTPPSIDREVGTSATVVTPADETASCSDFAQQLPVVSPPDEPNTEPDTTGFVNYSSGDSSFSLPTKAEVSSEEELSAEKMGMESPAVLISNSKPELSPEAHGSLEATKCKKPFPETDEIVVTEKVVTAPTSEETPDEKPVQAETPVLGPSTEEPVATKLAATPVSVVPEISGEICEEKDTAGVKKPVPSAVSSVDARAPSSSGFKAGEYEFMLSRKSDVSWGSDRYGMHAAVQSVTLGDIGVSKGDVVVGVNGHVVERVMTSEEVLKLIARTPSPILLMRCAKAHDSRLRVVNSYSSGGLRQWLEALFLKA